LNLDYPVSPKWPITSLSDCETQTTYPQLTGTHKMSSSVTARHASTIRKDKEKPYKKGDV